MASDDTATLPPEAAPSAEVGPGAGPQDRYVLLAQRARGGFGRIYTARDLRLGREVALKLIESDPQALARFEREVRLTAQLQHPSIIPIYDSGVWPSGEPFYAMKLVEGRTLKELLAERTTLEARLELLPHVLAIADAIAFAHSRRIVHRDLKPANVIVGPFGETNVIDWGLAKALDGDDEPTSSERRLGTDDETAAGTVLGTPAYMPPEQANAERGDERADVYMIGAILYHVLAGRLPYRGAESVEVLEQLRHGPPERLAALVPHAPRDLVAIVEKAMARRPEDRYRHAGEMTEDLRRFQAGQLVAAQQYSRRELAGRWVRRHAQGLIWTVMVLLAGFGVSGAAYVLGREGATDSCEAGGALIAPVWDVATRDRVSAAFQATGRTYAADSFQRLDTAMRQRLQRWTDGHRDACAATRVRHEQSDTMLDLRMQCLGRARRDLETLVQQLETADAAVLPRAAVAAASTGDVEACADTEALASHAPPAPDPAVAGEVEAIRIELSRARVLLALGKSKEAEKLLEELLARARAVRFPPVLADVLGADVQSRVSTGDADIGIEHAYELLRLGGEIGDPSVAEHALGELVFAFGSRKQRFETSDSLYRVADALVHRNGRASRYGPTLLSLRGQVLDRQGNNAGALGIRVAVLALAITESGPNSSRTGMALGYLAGSLGRLGHSKEAVPLFDRALVVLAASAGPEHPWFIAMLSNAAGNLIDRSAFAEATVLLDRALATIERLRGPDDRTLIGYLLKLGRVHFEQRHLAQARAYAERAIALATKHLGAEHPNVADGDAILAEIEMLERKPELARAYYEKILVIQRKTFGESHSKVAGSYLGLSAALLALDKIPEARAAAERSIAVDRATIGEDHPDHSDALMALAAVLVAEHKPAEAVPLYRRSLELLRTEQADDSPLLAVPYAGLCEALLGAGDLAGARAAATDGVRVAERAPADVKGRVRACQTLVSKK